MVIPPCSCNKDGGETDRPENDHNRPLTASSNTTHEKRFVHGELMVKRSMAKQFVEQPFGDFTTLFFGNEDELRQNMELNPSTREKLLADLQEAGYDLRNG
jgi:type I restriction enzyme R subunit